MEIIFTTKLQLTANNLSHPYVDDLIYNNEHSIINQMNAYMITLF